MADVVPVSDQMHDDFLEVAACACAQTPSCRLDLVNALSEGTGLITGKASAIVDSFILRKHPELFELPGINHTVVKVMRALLTLQVAIAALYVAVHLAVHYYSHLRAGSLTSEGALSWVPFIGIVTTGTLERVFTLKQRLRRNSGPRSQRRPANCADPDAWPPPPEGYDPRGPSSSQKL